jgi:hypothetical protein
MFHHNRDDNTNSTKSGILWVLFLALQVEHRSVARRIRDTHQKNEKQYLHPRPKAISQKSA